MSSWPPENADEAKAWEHEGHVLHYSWRYMLWECWAHHPDSCPAVQDGALKEHP